MARSGIGVVLVMLAAAGTPAHAADDNASRTLFLNRCPGGCVIEPGDNDARVDTSSIVSGTSLVTAFMHGDEVWAEVLNCVREIYAPYDIEVTDVDPGPASFHHEAIVAGDYPEIGLPFAAGGVAPAGCKPQNNVMSFTFANGYGPDALTICSVVAQESAHSFGLEHIYDCGDPMTYLNACGRQFFRDRVSECGEFSTRPCECGGGAKNSHRWLLQALGPNPTPVPGPELAMSAPDDGATVVDEFDVLATATHIRGIGHIDLYINGTRYGTVEGHEFFDATDPYRFRAPVDLSDGILDVEIRAYNDIGSESRRVVTVTKGEPCASDASCAAGQSCDEGRCSWPSLDVGAECSVDLECASQDCLQAADGEARCTQECFPTATENTCPDGLICLDMGGNSGRCWPEGGGGCGCRAGSRSGAASALLVAGVLALVCRRRRRRA